MPVSDPPIQEPFVADELARPPNAQSEVVSSAPLLTDWLRIALPLVVVVGFIVLAWRFGYFSLKTPAQLDEGREMDAGRLAAIKIGKRRLIPAAALQAWIANAPAA